MNCPKCNSELIYEEEIEGMFIYPISDDGIIDFEKREFYGDNLDHRIKCKNPDCNYIMPPKDFSRIFLVRNGLRSPSARARYLLPVASLLA